MGEDLKLRVHKLSGFDQRTAGAESLAGLNFLICSGIN